MLRADAFAVQDVAEGCNVMAAAKIRLLQIAFGEGEAIGKSKPRNGVAGNGNHAVPVDRGDADLAGTLGQRNAPYARSSSEIENAYRAGGGAEIEVHCQLLGDVIAHGQDVVDELSEKFGAGALLIDRSNGKAGGDNFVQMKPAGEQMLAGVTNESTLELRLGADQKCRGLRREAMSLRVLGEEIETNQHIHESRPTRARMRRLPGFTLLEGFRTAVEHVKDAVP